MWLHSLFNSSLLALPVALTVGVYIGVEWPRIIRHQVGLGPGSGGQAPSVETNTYCQKEYGISPFPGRYIFNPNQWGDPDNLGNLCMSITTNSSVSDKAFEAANFSATWEFPIGPVDEPVHAFPNAMLDLPDIIPLTLSNLSAFTLDVSWTYGLGDYVHNVTDFASMSAAEVNANVCLDMFLAADPSNSTNTTTATYEVMVWLGRWGDASQPIGLAQGPVASQTVNGTTFSLFSGENALEQKVHTWIADSNTTEFNGDVSPLLFQLADNGGPGPDDNLGYVAFGSETWYSFENVTFYVPRLVMNPQAGS